LRTDCCDAKRGELQREGSGAILPRNARPGNGGALPETQLLSQLPTHLTNQLFARANPVKLVADQVLFIQATGAIASRMVCLR
jgi:hypothetical protein